jgi:hypothetical protein
MLCSCFFAVFTSFSIFCRIVAALEAKLIKQNDTKKIKKNKENCKFSFFGKKIAPLEAKMMKNDKQKNTK